MTISHSLNAATRLPGIPRDKRGLGPRALAVLSSASAYAHSRRLDLRDEWSLPSRSSAKLGND